VLFDAQGLLYEAQNWLPFSVRQWLNDATVEFAYFIVGYLLLAICFWHAFFFLCLKPTCEKLEVDFAKSLKLVDYPYYIVGTLGIIFVMWGIFTSQAQRRLDQLNDRRSQLTIKLPQIYGDLVASCKSDYYPTYVEIEALTSPSELSAHSYHKQICKRLDVEETLPLYRADDVVMPLCRKANWERISNSNSETFLFVKGMAPEHEEQVRKSIKFCTHLGEHIYIGYQIEREHNRRQFFDSVPSDDRAQFGWYYLLLFFAALRVTKVSAELFGKKREAKDETAKVRIE
jgi:hypothetical protein